jgi:hypothetical protein
MTSAGLLTAQKSDCLDHGGTVKEKIQPLLGVSADSRDSVERIRQTPSDESTCRNFADIFSLITGRQRRALRRIGDTRRPKGRCERIQTIIN